MRDEGLTDWVRVLEGEFGCVGFGKYFLDDLESFGYSGLGFGLDVMNDIIESPFFLGYLNWIKVNNIFYPFLIT